jgi:16S rRNA (cytidine1402-2'-O)-methyltransferase
MTRPGTLYLIPTPLGEGDGAADLPPRTAEVLADLADFVVEHPKSARAFLRRAGYPRPLAGARMEVLDEHTAASALERLLSPLLAGRDLGLVSEAGCPAVADPGAPLVRLAHRHGIRVVPLVGPSSILLALMASGLNGQRFRFHGYLPAQVAARDAALRALERESRERDQTEIFIETPYRGARMLDALLALCRPGTWLTVAADLTLATESVTTRRVADWKQHGPALARRPAVFLLYAAD